MNRFFFTTLLLTSVGLTTPLSALRVNAQQSSGLPLTIEGGHGTKKTMTVSLEQKPTKNLGLNLKVKGAEGAQEGWLYVNGQVVAPLFSWYANPSNRNQIASVRLVTPGAVWRAGLNDVTFVARNNNTFKVLTANTYETERKTHFTNIANRNRTSTISARRPVRRSSSYTLTQAPQAIATASVGRKTLTLTDLIATVTQPHDVPAPGVPQSFDFQQYPRPSVASRPERLDQPLPAGSGYVNTWNHIDSLQRDAAPNVKVEMGSMFLSFFKDGKWHTTEMGPPCRAYTYEYPTIGTGKDTDVAACENGAAFAGLGLKGWNKPNRHTHGWVQNGRVGVNSEDVEHFMVWASARTQPIDPGKPANLDGQNYQYGIGGDYFNSDEGRGRKAAVHSRRQIVGSQWKTLVGHNMTPQTIKTMCAQGNLPSELPLVGGCSSSSGAFRAGTSSTPNPSPKSLAKATGQSSRTQTASVPFKRTGTGVLTLTQLRDAVTKPHEQAPAPTVPSSYCQAYNGKPSTLNHPSNSSCKNEFGDDQFKKYRTINPWFVAYSRTKTPDTIEMGDMYISVLKRGVWTTHNFGPPGQAYLFKTESLNKREAKDVATLGNGVSKLGYGLDKWQNPALSAHGWPGPHWDIALNDAEHMMVWVDARTQKEGTHAVGAGLDLRDNVLKTGLPAAIRTRQRFLGPQWTTIVGHNIHPDQLATICQKYGYPSALKVEGCPQQ
ncbi:hypothetical protein C1752_10469 [Acaryochloris thomasi RCC1774]|uniref:Uncharacterized protein n=1 Tax=Acaryochloris thomasi RCC1774 TaxID=1764569 RepID=A0A2W1J865_9CYAN|nr:hypothetical protein [Acaryochloris thomasi]PZD70619.1 hypothetical protein C1752_10469 [Acaryochloris thomasi RCC1774]